jgi:ParB-like chromosome segregation protein Spo0J
MTKYTVLVLDEIYTHKLVEADSEEAIYVGDYNVIEEWEANAGECDQIINIERNPD